MNEIANDRRNTWVRVRGEKDEGWLFGALLAPLFLEPFIGEEIFRVTVSFNPGGSPAADPRPPGAASTGGGGAGRVGRPVAFGRADPVRTRTAR